MQTYFPMRDSDRCGQVFSVTCWVMIVLNKPFFSHAFHGNHHKLPAAPPSTIKLGEGMMCSYLFCKEMKYLSSANTNQEQRADRQRLISGPCGSTSPLGRRDGPCSCWDPPPLFRISKPPKTAKKKVLTSQEEKLSETQGSAQWFWCWVNYHLGKTDDLCSKSTSHNSRCPAQEFMCCDPYQFMQCHFI